MSETMIRCPICKRKQPESLGACDFCAEMQQDVQEESEFWFGGNAIAREGGYD